MTDESVARFFDEANGPLSDDVAALRAAHPGAPLVTCSHFVPRIELVPEKRFLYVPALNKAVGSRFLGDRVAELKPDVHVFGHTHFGWDATHDGVRYLQPCLAYPSERRVRLTTVAAGDFPHAKGPLLVFDGSRFPARYVCGWSSFYEHNERRPDVTHVVPDYVARAYKRVAGVGEVGWGDPRRDARLALRAVDGLRQPEGPDARVGNGSGGTRGAPGGSTRLGHAQENQPVGASAGTHVVVKLMPFRDVVVFFIVLPSSEISKVARPMNPVSTQTLLTSMAPPSFTEVTHFILRPASSVSSTSVVASRGFGVPTLSDIMLCLILMN
ncbi:calcineurin-like phosphoesterase [Aureococcus anophagefferens]|nr:calcineurin-like phosphoesterase [Aureococcus anophagefferens]